MSVITNIEDLRLLAKRRVPRMFYDYADSGSWTEGTYRANEADFQKIKLRQNLDDAKAFEAAAHKELEKAQQAMEETEKPPFVVTIPVPPYWHAE